MTNFMQKKCKLYQIIHFGLPWRPWGTSRRGPWCRGRGQRSTPRNGLCSFIITEFFIHQERQKKFPYNIGYCFPPAVFSVYSFFWWSKRRKKNCQTIMKGSYMSNAQFTHNPHSWILFLYPSFCVATFSKKERTNILQDDIWTEIILGSALKEQWDINNVRFII